MADFIPREEILAKLRSRAESGCALLAFGAGSGLSARSAEAGGADYISIYTAAARRMEGLPSLLAWLPYGDVNEEMRALGRKILPLVNHTPCVAGLGVHDPRISIPVLVNEFICMGFSGVSNEPFCSTYGAEMRALLDRAGMGTARELALIRCARERNVFSAAWAADAAEAEAFAEAGADVVGLLAGFPREAGESAADHFDRVLRLLRGMTEAVRRASPEALVLVHGGVLDTPEAVEKALRATGADGCATGSGGERIPAETAIRSIAEQYRGLKTNG